MHRNVKTQERVDAVAMVRHQVYQTRVEGHSLHQHYQTKHFLIQHSDGQKNKKVYPISPQQNFFTKIRKMKMQLRMKQASFWARNAAFTHDEFIKSGLRATTAEMRPENV